MPSTYDIMRYFYGMFKLHGAGCKVAKTDEKGAFRQLFLAILEIVYCVYSFLGLKLGDCYDIWGTRSGSKHTQELGQVIARFFMFMYNKEDRMPIVNELLDTPNVVVWKQKYDNRKINISEEEKVVLRWEYKELNKWFKDQGCPELSWLTIAHITSGEILVNLNENTIKNWGWSDRFTKEILEHHQLLEKIAILKIKIRKLPLVILDNYVDDFFWIMPPIQSLAEHITKSFGECLDKIGIEEELSKREGPSTRLEIIGLTWDTIEMTVQPSDDKINKILNMLYKFKTLECGMLDEFESLIGKLSFCAALMWPGKAFLRRLRELLYEYIAKYKRKRTMIAIPNWAVEDINWWIHAMENIQPLSIIDECESRFEDIVMSTDGATNGSREKGWNPGVGGHMEGNLLMANVPEKYLGMYESKERNYTKEYAIAHFEMLGIIFTLWNLRNKFNAGQRILIRCDNKIVESVLKSKNSADLFLMQGVRWICMFAVRRKLRFFIKYIWTKNNVIADALSRFDPKEAEQYVTDKTQYKINWVKNVCFPDINIYR